MTYQKPSPAPDDNKAETASSLFLNNIGPPSSTPSFSFGPGGGGKGPARTKKHRGVSRNALVATTCVLLLGTLAVLYYGGRGGGSSSSSHHRGTPEDPPLSKNDMMLVDVQGGKPCCPYDMDECTSYHNYLHVGVNCVHEGMSNDAVEEKWDYLPDGTICKPRIGGFCCADSTANHYTWYAIHFGGMVGCVQEKCFRCLDGSNCCFEGTGVRDSSCPGCDDSCFKCVSGEKCCHTFDGSWNFNCFGCGGSF